MRRPLTFGRLPLDELAVQRSGLRWLVPNGHRCRAGQLIAYCNVGVRWRVSGRPAPFADEVRDLQLTFSLAVDGIVHIRRGLSLGGDLDQLHFFQNWDPDEVLAEVETDDQGSPLSLGAVAGRRVSELAEDRSGLLTGWHSRARAWHADGSGHVSLLSLGICEQTGIFRGEQGGFAELLGAAPGPLHAAHIGDEALVPCSRILIEQRHRDPAHNRRVVESVARGILGNDMSPGSADLLFAGAASAALTRNPLAERHDVLTRDGLATNGNDAIVLSIHAEPHMLLRHRRLGYHAFWHRFRLAAAGPAVREWIQTEFETVRRTRDDIKRDLIELRQSAAAAGIGHVLILNAMSSSGHETITSYRSFEGDLADHLGTIGAKETNLMLHDLAEEADVTIVDVDAIAAAIGGADNLPDSVHQSRHMQGEVRREIMHHLRSRGAFSTPLETRGALHDVELHER